MFCSVLIIFVLSVVPFVCLIGLYEDPLFFPSCFLTFLVLVLTFKSNIVSFLSIYF